MTSIVHPAPDCSEAAALRGAAEDRRPRRAVRRRRLRNSRPCWRNRSVGIRIGDGTVADVHDSRRREGPIVARVPIPIRALHVLYRVTWAPATAGLSCRAVPACIRSCLGSAQCRAHSGHAQPGHAQRHGCDSHLHIGSLLAARPSQSLSMRRRPWKILGVITPRSDRRAGRRRSEWLPRQASAEATSNRWSAPRRGGGHQVIRAHRDSGNSNIARSFP